MKDHFLEVNYFFIFFIYFDLINIFIGRPHGKGKLTNGSNTFNVEFIEGKMKKKTNKDDLSQDDHTRY